MTRVGWKRLTHINTNFCIQDRASPHLRFQYLVTHLINEAWVCAPTRQSLITCSSWIAPSKNDSIYIKFIFVKFIFNVSQIRHIYCWVFESVTMIFKSILLKYIFLILIYKILLNDHFEEHSSNSQNLIRENWQLHLRCHSLIT